MFPTIDFPLVEHALTRPAGWIDLALVIACFALGWFVDRRVRLKADAAHDVIRVGAGGVNRLIFPLLTLVLLVIASVLYQRYRTPFFLALALPAVVALAVIRLFVYALRGVFPRASWLATSERAVSFAVWGLLLLYFLGILHDIAADLDALVIPIAKSHVSVLDIGKAVLVVLLTLAITLWISGFIEGRLMRAEQLDSSLRALAAKAVRAVLLILAVLIALNAVGIDLTLLSVFGGALGVGIGLGLQKLASNYIAGFTILLDRSIRLGDMITVDNRFGVVSKVTARYVVVRSLDGVEAVVPNETLVTTTVLNHSYSTREIRIGVPIQVSYGSDLELALRLMEGAALAEARVLKAPNPPAAFVIRFADSGVDLELGFWINDPENGQANLRSAVYLAVWRAFQAHGIDIPFPQREVRIVGGVPAAADAAGTVGERTTAAATMPKG
ncbi:MAG: mechanosensitive ion channel [Betaproteobacteria bacterium]|nr:mechanosensitive ion channel [Betaproteobacteria bacterium]